MNKKDYNIHNIGFINEEIILDKIIDYDIVIFPSLKESFGLGLIEASQLKIPIFASKQQFVKDIINPSALFDPYNSESIYNTMMSSEKHIKSLPKLLVKNKIDELIALFKI